MSSIESQDPQDAIEAPDGAKTALIVRDEGPAAAACPRHGVVSRCRDAAQHRPREFDCADELAGRVQANRRGGAARSARSTSRPGRDLRIGALAVIHKVVRMPNNSLLVFCRGSLERIR
jgi:hypothetical protein